MKHARTKVETYKDQTIAAASEGSIPSPGTNTDTSSTARPMSDTNEARQPGEDPLVSANRAQRCLTPVGGPVDKTAAITHFGPCKSVPASLVDCAHLWVLEDQLVIRGMVVTGKECTELPWRRKKDGEPASQAEIAREIELVKALYIGGKVQAPTDFADTKLFIREDIK